MTASKIIITFTCENCGKIVQRYKRTDSKFRFCSVSCSIKNAIEIARKIDRRKEKNPAWKGGIRYALGYKYLLKPDHPSANDKGYVQEHRLIMEDYLGRYLTNQERVHHKNKVKDDNRIENLKLYSNQGSHIKKHLENGDINSAYWTGKKMSKETRIKMSISAKKAWKYRK